MRMVSDTQPTAGIQVQVFRSIVAPRHPLISKNAQAVSHRVIFPQCLLVSNGVTWVSRCLPRVGPLTCFGSGVYVNRTRSFVIAYSTVLSSHVVQTRLDPPRRVAVARILTFERGSRSRHSARIPVATGPAGCGEQPRCGASPQRRT